MDDVLSDSYLDRPSDGACFSHPCTFDDFPLGPSRPRVPFGPCGPGSNLTLLKLNMRKSRIHRLRARAMSMTRMRILLGRV